MNSLQLEALIFLRAYVIFTDEEWQSVFMDTPSSQAYACSMWNRLRVMASGKTSKDMRVASTHKACCLTCRTVYDNWPNGSGVDLLRQCFKCGGYVDTHWEATLLGRVMLYG